MRKILQHQIKSVAIQWGAYRNITLELAAGLVRHCPGAPVDALTAPVQGSPLRISNPPVAWSSPPPA
jgi:hypothetical protein